jgi:cyclophilin family peptidyl-prolyl cis-trans isomerase
MFEALLLRTRKESDLPTLGMVALSLGRLPLVSLQDISAARHALLSVAARAEGNPAALINATRALETIVRRTWRLLPPDSTLVARLRALAGSEAAAPEVRRHALGGLLTAQLADSVSLAQSFSSDDPQLRRLAATGLAHLVPGLERTRLAERALADTAPMVRLEAVRLWPRLAGPAACSRLVGAMEDPSAMVALLAIDLLGECPGNTLAIGTLQDAAAMSGNPSWHRASHALVSLARIAPEGARRLLAASAGQPAWQGRMYAARAAAELGEGSLLERLAKDPIANVREAALVGLLKVREHGADRWYRAALSALDYQTVITAANGLRGTGTPAPAVAALLGGLDRITAERKETSRDARVALLSRLRELGTSTISGRLLPYLADFDPAIADSAATILAALTGQVHRARPRRLPPPMVAPAAVKGFRDSTFRVTMASGGSFEVELLMAEAPLTVARIVRLVRRGYYNGLSFHRVVPNFVVQGGSPGANEYSGDGPFMRDELGPRSHERGTLGTSTRGRDTGDGQFFVNLVDNPRLDYDYTVWGRIVSGIETVDAIMEGDVIRRIELRSAGWTSLADTAALMTTVRVLAADSMEGRRAGSPGGARARRYLVQRLTALGLQPLGKDYEQSFALPDHAGTGVNLLALIPGNRFPDRYIVVSAHYDHVGILGGQIYNGADDNASGTAALLAIAGALRRAPIGHSVILALFDGEEAGLLGAKAFLAALPVPASAVALDVNLDMVSHSATGELWVAGTAYHPTLRPALEALRAHAPVRLRFGHDRRGVPGQQDWTNDSDHGPFHAAGIPFLYFGVEDHPDYHRPTDDPETITPVFFGRAVGTILAALRMVDELVP